MGKLVLFMHVSLDGFVAGPGGEMDWIKVDEEIFDYVAKRIEGTDTALYGRVTYQMMESYWPTAAEQPGATKHDIEHGAWYSRAKKVVLSKTLEGQSLPMTHIISDNVKSEVNRIKSENEKYILIFGSPTAAHSLMAEGLIDEYWLFINPIILSKGIPLFKNIPDKEALTTIQVKNFTSGVVCLQYSKK